MIRTTETRLCDDCRTPWSFAWYTGTNPDGTEAYRWCGRCAGVPEPTTAQLNAGWRPPSLPPRLGGDIGGRSSTPDVTLPERSSTPGSGQLALDLQEAAR